MSKPRFDVVEVAITRDAGGEIASSTALLRPTGSPAADTAVAVVLAVLNVAYRET